MTNAATLHPSDESVANSQGLLQKTSEACADVVFGTPGKNCFGLGICLVIGPRFTHIFRKGCVHIPASISVRHDGCLAFSFQQHDLPASIDQQHLTSHFFLVEERFSIPLHIARLLGFSQRIWVPAGQYRIVKTVAVKTLLLRPESPRNS